MKLVAGMTSLIVLHLNLLASICWILLGVGVFRLVDCLTLGQSLGSRTDCTSDPWTEGLGIRELVSSSMSRVILGRNTFLLDGSG
eukprot:15173218-Ditylum_brightwellii.AAC.1